MAVSEGVSDDANTRSRQRAVAFHVTGFGVFNGISDNPTTHLVRELPGELEARRRRLLAVQQPAAAAAAPVAAAASAAPVAAAASGAGAVAAVTGTVETNSRVVGGGRGKTKGGAGGSGGGGGVGWGVGGIGLPAYGKGFEVRSCVVLDVSAEKGGRQLREVHANADRDNSCARENGDGSGSEDKSKGGGGNRGGGGRSAETRVECEAKAETKAESIAEAGAKPGAEDVAGGGSRDGTVSVFVHCGVNGGASKFAVETQGFNEATFGAPDERGYCPTFAPVDEGNPDTSHCRVTTLPVERILERLRNVGWGREHVSESADAGRFVCNYVYYTSLGLCEKAMAAMAGPAAEAAEAVGVAAGAEAAVAVVAAANEDDTVKSVEERREEEGRGACSSNGDAGEKDSSVSSGGGSGSGNSGGGDGRAAGDRHSVFLHVPPFKAIPKEQQLAFLVDFLSAIAASVAGSEESVATRDVSPAAGIDGVTSAGDAISTAAAAATSTATAAAAAAATSTAATGPGATCLLASSVSSPRKPSLLPSPKREPSASETDPPVPRVSFAPIVEVGIASPPMPSIWDSSGSPENSPQLPPPAGGTRASSCGHDGSRSGKGFGGAGDGGADDNDSGYAQDDDYDEVGETAAGNTRWRLVEAGFDELDVDAAMATTRSDQIEVNMQFLMDVAPLLPRGAPSDPGALHLRDLGNSGSGGGSGSGESFGRVRGTVGGGGGGGGGAAAAARGGNARGKGGASPAGMGGVSPRWVGAVSPGGRALKSGGGFGMTPPTPPSRFLSVASDPSSTAFASAAVGAAAGSAAAGDRGSSNDAARGKNGGLLGKLRRHKRGSSTASESNEDGGGGGEYCRQTTGNLRSHSPSPVRAGVGTAGAGGAVAGVRRGQREVIAGWGATLPSGPNLRLALLVRQDLGLGRGAVASQCCRAALAATRKAESSGRADTLAVWRSEGESMVVLGATDAGTLDAVLAVGAASGLAITMVREKHAAWVGNVTASTCTVAALGPAPMSAIRAVAGGMPLL